MQTKLVRNLKAGDKLKLVDIDGKRTHLLEVRKVEETRPGYLTGKRQWKVVGDYPWWFPLPVVGYSNSRITLA